MCIYTLYTVNIIIHTKWLLGFITYMALYYKSKHFKRLRPKMKLYFCYSFCIYFLNQTDAFASHYNF